MRAWFLGLIVVLALLLAACGGASAPGGNAATSGASATATPAVTPVATSAPAATATSTATPDSGTSASAGPSAAVITMAGFSFSSDTAVSIKAGQAVTFNDPASGGGTHILVTGRNGTFSVESGAPGAFASPNGAMFSPGMKQNVTFATPGTYHITCTIHPSMGATITVTP